MLYYMKCCIWKYFYILIKHWNNMITGLCCQMKTFLIDVIWKYSKFLYKGFQVLKLTNKALFFQWVFRKKQLKQSWQESWNNPLLSLFILITLHGGFWMHISKLKTEGETAMEIWFMWTHWMYSDSNKTHWVIR